MEKLLRSHRIAGAGILICTVALYLPTIGFDFLQLDDITYILSNPMVASGFTWEGFQWAFSSLELNQWMPVSMLSLMLDAELFGVDSAGGWHLVNVLLHALNCLLLLWALRGLLLHPWQRLFVTALFAFHPMHIEVVAWVVERKELLAMTFGLISWIAFQRWRRSRESVFYLLSCLAFLASLGSKPMWVSWPLILLVIEWSENNFRWRSLSTILIDKLPLLAMSALIGVLTLYKAAAWTLLDEPRPEMFTEPLSSAVSALGFYLVKSILPYGLSTFYELWPGSYTSGEVLFAGLLVTAGSGLAIAVVKRQPLVLAGWFWFIVGLIPISGLFQHHNQWVAIRFSYFPHVGFFISITILLSGLIRIYPRLLGLSSVLGVLLLAGFAWGTSEQQDHWRNSERFWQRAIEVTGGGPVIHYYFGDYFSMVSRHTEALEQYEAANRLASANGFVLTPTLQRAALIALRSGRKELCRERTRMLLEHGFNEEELSAVAVLGRDLTVAGEYSLAIDVLSKLLQNYVKQEYSWLIMARLVLTAAYLESDKEILADEQLNVSMATVPGLRADLCELRNRDSGGMANKLFQFVPLPQASVARLQELIESYCHRSENYQ